MPQYNKGSSQEMSGQQDSTSESTSPRLLTVTEPLPLQECKIISEKHNSYGCNIQLYITQFLTEFKTNHKNHPL